MSSVWSQTLGGGTRRQVAAEASREALPQFAAEDFTRRCARDGVYKMHFARLLMVGEAVGYKGAEFTVELGRWR